MTLSEGLQIRRVLRIYKSPSAAWSSKISTFLMEPRRVSTLLCLLTSINLNTEAPRAAALVRKPERRLWPEKSAGS